MSTYNQSSKADGDVTFRPLIKLSKSTQRDLVDLLEKVPPRALSYEIVRRLALSLSFEMRASSFQNEAATTQAASEPLGTHRDGDGLAQRSIPLIAKQIASTPEVGVNEQVDDIGGLERLGIRSAADFNDAFDWKQP